MRAEKLCQKGMRLYNDKQKKKAARLLSRASHLGSGKAAYWLDIMRNAGSPLGGAGRCLAHHRTLWKIALGAASAGRDILARYNWILYATKRKNPVGAFGLHRFYARGLMATVFFLKMSLSAKEIEVLKRHEKGIQEAIDCHAEELLLMAGGMTGEAGKAVVYMFKEYVYYLLSWKEGQDPPESFSERVKRWARLMETVKEGEE